VFNNWIKINKYISKFFCSGEFQRNFFRDIIGFYLSIGESNSKDAQAHISALDVTHAALQKAVGWTRLRFEYLSWYICSDSTECPSSNWQEQVRFEFARDALNIWVNSGFPTTHLFVTIFVQRAQQEQFALIKVI